LLDIKFLQFDNDNSADKRISETGPEAVTIKMECWNYVLQTFVKHQIYFNFVYVEQNHKKCGSVNIFGMQFDSYKWRTIKDVRSYKILYE
jgi:hypothetical protein